jgi:glycine/sarcosine N-methyltransferase
MNNQNLLTFAESEENSKIRAEIWTDFVGWDTRRRGENGFLVTQLKKYKCKTVLDVALGDGVDTIFLLQQGFEVASNEVDSAYREKAIENAEKLGFKISPANLDWRNLTQEYQANSFDAIICMGNSITCLFGRENQLKALKEFHSILKPSVILIIDERNYQRILDNKEAALAGSLRSTGKYLYTRTTKVQARFLEITEDLILIEYIHKESGKRAYYKVYPFKRGELLQLIREAGFFNVEKFSDYEMGDNSEADFFQYVCIK